MAFLLSPAGSDLLADLAARQVTAEAALSHITRLRKTYPPDMAAAALDLALLRQRAAPKFSRAAEMFFTRVALEQASAEVVAGHRAQRFAPFSATADLCCGIGGDAIALAAHSEVLAVDRDPLRLDMALANAQVYGVGDRLRTVCADVTTVRLDPGMAVWADPARRVGGRRVFSLHAYEPPLPTLLERARQAPGAGIKLSPGVRYAELEAVLAGIPHEVEIISVRREAREAVLWLGALRSEALRRATVLPGGHTLTDQPLQAAIPTGAPRRYLYEPDPAVIRAHLVEQLAQAINAHKLDDEIAYLTASAPVETPFASRYVVDEVLPFSLKQLNRRLQSMDVGQLVIKKRGFAVDPEQFRKRLKYKGGRGSLMVLVLTHVQGQPTALICRPA